MCNKNGWLSFDLCVADKVLFTNVIRNSDYFKLLKPGVFYVFRVCIVPSKSHEKYELWNTGGAYVSVGEIFFYFENFEDIDNILNEMFLEISRNLDYDKLDFYTDQWGNTYEKCFKILIRQCVIEDGVWVDIKYPDMAKTLEDYLYSIPSIISYYWNYMCRNYMCRNYSKVSITGLKLSKVVLDLEVFDELSIYNTFRVVEYRGIEFMAIEFRDIKYGVDYSLDVLLSRVRDINSNNKDYYNIYSFNFNVCENGDKQIVFKNFLNELFNRIDIRDGYILDGEGLVHSNYIRFILREK